MNVTRRSFTKLMAGFFAAPLWSWGEEDETVAIAEGVTEFEARVKFPSDSPEALLSSFCGFQEVPRDRWEIDSPFHLQGCVWATDNIAVARIRTGKGAVSEDRQRLIPDNFEAVWRTHYLQNPRPKYWTPLPEQDFQLPAGEQKGYCPRCFLDTECACVECGRSGAMLKTTEEGELYTQTCGKCGGDGVNAKPECPLCRGKYNSHIACHQHVFDKVIDGRNWLRIASIPDVEISPGREESQTPILFRSPAGIEGMLCTVAPPSLHNYEFGAFDEYI